jgi:hypothetical protein
MRIATDGPLFAIGRMDSQQSLVPAHKLRVVAATVLNRDRLVDWFFLGEVDGDE